MGARNGSIGALPPENPLKIVFAIWGPICYPFFLWGVFSPRGGLFTTFFQLIGAFLFMFLLFSSSYGGSFSPYGGPFPACHSECQSGPINYKISKRAHAHCMKYCIKMLLMIKDRAVRLGLQDM